jgi:hypothetical protein
MNHQQAQYTRGLQLQGQLTVIEFNAGCQQSRSSHGLTQNTADRWRIITSFHHSLPGGVQMNNLAANGEILEEETA